MPNSKAWRAAALIIVAAAFALQGSYIIGLPGASAISPTIGTPAFIQATEAHSSGTPTSLSVSFGVLPATKHVAILATFGTSIGSAGFKVTDNQGNAYSQLIGLGTLNGIPGLWCAPILTSSGTFTITATATTNVLIGVFALEYSGTSCNLDKAAATLSNTSPYNCGSLTTQNAKDLLLVLLDTLSSTGTITYTAPTGFTIEKSQGVAATGQTAAIADQIVSATATYAPTFGASQNISSTPCLSVALLSSP